MNDPRRYVGSEAMHGNFGDRGISMTRCRKVQGLLAIWLICGPESRNHLLIPPKKMWSQIYDPFGNTFLSTVAAVIPIAVLLGGIGLF